MRELLESLPKSSGYAFPSPRTKERPVDIKKSFEAARTAAKLSDFRFPDLRHTAATRLGSAGVNAFTLCSIFGWSDLRVALRYTHAVSKARHEAVEKLAEKPTSGDESVTKEIQPPGTAAVNS
jgi:integrase